MLLAALALPAASACASVIITEIMFNPQGTDNDHLTNPTTTREWVEIYNTGETTVDLSGWRFGDAADNNWATPFPTGTSLAPQQALVITGDAQYFDANWGAGINRIQVGMFPNLANTIGANEAAAIRNAAGVIQDQVRFQDEGWPSANGSDGNSVFLLPGAFSTTANDLPANWRPSSAGAYGARWVNAGGMGENHGSPGVVVTTLQEPFAPTPGARWSMVVLPDTQNYSKSSRDMPLFFQMTNWIKDHRETYDIGLVMQVGDLVNNNNNSPSNGDLTGDQQWANARAAMSVLDGHVPYIITLGNHDMGTTNAQTRDTQFNTYFNPSQNPLNDPAQGGILKGVYQPGRLDNAYFELIAPDGRKLLVFALEFLPRQGVVNWANQIAGLHQYKDHTAVLLTHTYLNWNNNLTADSSTSYGVANGGDFNNGVNLWNELVRLQANFEMTFSGHVGGDGLSYVPATGNAGNTVHQMLLNAQFETNGGNGWFRLVEFLDDGKTARVRTFSPFLGYARDDAANDYYIDLSQLVYDAADFDRNGKVDGHDFAAWLANFGEAGPGSPLGDSDGDGDADGDDFLRWQRAFGALAPLPSGLPVPEPGGVIAYLAVAAWTCVALARRPRRRW